MGDIPCAVVHLCPFTTLLLHLVLVFLSPWITEIIYTPRLQLQGLPASVVLLPTNGQITIIHRLQASNSYVCKRLILMLLNCECGLENEKTSEHPSACAEADVVFLDVGLPLPTQFEMEASRALPIPLTWPLGPLPSIYSAVTYHWHLDRGKCSTHILSKFRA